MLAELRGSVDTLKTVFFSESSLQKSTSALCHSLNIMSTESAIDSAATQSAKTVHVHPLAPLSEKELRDAAAIIRASWPAHTKLHFKVVTLQEPPKAEVVPYLEAEHNGRPLPLVSRRAFINYYIRNTVSSICGSIEDI